MKISVSLSDDDLEALDAYARETGLPSRSAAIQRAIRSLRLADLETSYAAAWAEWEESGAEGAWAAVASDGLTDATR